MRAALKKLSGIKDSTTFWKVLVAEAVRMTKSEAGYFAAINPQGDTLTLLGWSESLARPSGPVQKPAPFRVLDAGAWGDCVRQDRVVILNAPSSTRGPQVADFPLAHLEVNRQLSVPVKPGSVLVGVLGVANSQTDYKAPDATLLQMFVAQAWQFASPFINQ